MLSIKHDVSDVKLNVVDRNTMAYIDIRISFTKTRWNNNRCVTDNIISCTVKAREEMASLRNEFTC